MACNRQFGGSPPTPSSFISYYLSLGRCSLYKPKDDAERSAQVQMMKDIYSCARVVRIWLGEAFDSSDDVLKVVEHISKNCPTNDPSSREDFLRNIHINGQSLVGDGSESARQNLNCITSFINRSWWSRVWVLQEAVLARTAVVHCGFHSTLLEDFFNAANKVSDAFNIPAVMQSRLRDTSGELWAVVGILRSLRDLLRASDPNTPGDTILKILAYGRIYQATNPRDKIYGMLGLLPNRTVRLSVNYE